MVKIFKKLNNRQVINYFIWGISTTVVNIGLFTMLCTTMDYHKANLIAIIACKVYAYVVNKLFVFCSRCKDMGAFIHEIFRYLISRGFTGVLDYLGVIILVEYFNVNKIISKYLIMITVMILNFLLGKYAVFRKK